MEIPGAVISHTVDEEGRRTRDAVASAFGKISLDPCVCLLALDIAVKPRLVEAESCYEIADLPFGERRLLFVKPVVHFPEPALPPGRFHDSCDKARARMRGFVGEMSEDKGQAFAKRLT